MKTITLDLSMSPEEFTKLCQELTVEELVDVAKHLKEMNTIINTFGPIAVKIILKKMAEQVFETAPEGVTLQ